MALDLSQNFVPTQYLKKEWIEFNKILHTRSRSGLFCVNLCKFIKELWPLTRVRILYRLNISRLNEGNLIKLCIWIDIDKLWVGIVMHQSVQIHNRVMTDKSC